MKKRNGKPEQDKPFRNALRLSIVLIPLVSMGARSAQNPLLQLGASRKALCLKMSELTVLRDLKAMDG